MSRLEFIWSDLTGPGMEHLTLARNDDGYVADGFYLGCGEESPPYRIHYVIHINPAWEMRSAAVELLTDVPQPERMSLSVDESCTWRDGDDEPLAQLSGCHEIDLFCTPFTNSLVIRRLGLTRGESAEISVAYVEVPLNGVRPVRQRYTCLEPLGPEGGVYRYEPLFRGSAYDLQVDAEGLVTEYPGAFRRVFTG